MRRRVIYTLILLIVFGGVPVYAQSNSLGLSDADYALLREANAAAVQQYSLTYTLQAAVEGLDSFALTADLSGSGVVDVPQRALSLQIHGSMTLGTAALSTLNTDVRWINDALYLNPGDGWQALKPASTFAANAISQYVGLSADDGAIQQWDLTGVDGFSDVLAAVTAIDPNVFLSGKRLADDTVGDIKAAHFQINGDVQALMQSDAFVDGVMAFAAVQGNDLVIHDRKTLAEIVRTNSTLFKGSTISLEQYVGLDDHLILRDVLALDVKIDPSLGGYADPAFSVKVNADFTFDGLNQAQRFSVPTGAEMVDRFTLTQAVSPVTAAAGVTQYVFFETVGENESYSQSFEAQSGDSVTISVRGLGLEFDSIAKLLAPDGATLAEDDDHETSAFGLGFPDPQIADFKIDQSGRYQVQVHEIDGAAGSFVLTISVHR